MIAACDRLKLEGTRSRWTTSHQAVREALLPYVDYLKVDIRSVNTQQSAAMSSGAPRCCLLAMKVETRLQFITAVKHGFSMLQGYFFRHPERMRARHIPANKASQLRLLKEISAAEVNLGGIENLLRQDASLC